MNVERLPVPSATTPPSARVLVVDDSTDLRHITTTILTYNGYEVIEAFDGQDGLESLCRFAPDLVILDLNMPVMDGWQFRAAQQRLSDGQLAAIPVLIVTAADADDAHARPLDAAGFIHKPFDSAELIVAVKRAIQQQRV